MKSKYKSGRSVFALIVVCLVIFSFAADLFNIQVKNNEYYTAQNNPERKYVVELEAARGEIVDRNGNSLVTNRQGNSIILNAAFFPSQKDNKRRNEIIYNLIKLFEKNKEEYAQNLPPLMQTTQHESVNDLATLGLNLMDEPLGMRPMQ